MPERVNGTIIYIIRMLRKREANKNQGLNACRTKRKHIIEKKSYPH
ncbi:MAG: hypothetical protein Hyperionvirus27_20 [Hyperionvirus sp.]|uniref:Uncharacterized protein n=1 Tax=Hyperionvirus sp. TaxID=2487770 RepID=A0A3G5ABC7_9VIRU|nr:MAG: hypothetical protein Hyperionvirus27_20 [Hyperionvirus sp.]